MIKVIIGGILAIIGGIIGRFLEAKYARRVKKEEIIAEKQIFAIQGAYDRATRIKGMLLMGTTKEARDAMREYSDWFFANRLFLPHRFSENWITIQSNIAKKDVFENDLQHHKKEVIDLYDANNRLVEEAIGEIERCMRLPKLEVKKKKEINKVSRS